jgi:hypothetical protein
MRAQPWAVRQLWYAIGPLGLPIKTRLSRLCNPQFRFYRSNAVTISTMVIQQARAFEDIFDSERKARLAAEGSNQELRALILEIAVRLDGQRLESMRRDDPTIPACWTLAEWRLFFASMQPAVRQAQTGWNGEPFNKKSSDDKAAEEMILLRGMLSAAQAKLAEADAELKKARAISRFERKEKHKAPPVGEPVETNNEIVIDEAVLEAQAAKEPLSFAGMVVELRGFSKNIPPLPAAYQDLGKNGRAWERYLLAIHLLGRWGIAAKIEISEILGRAVINHNTGQPGVKGGSGSLHGILENLDAYGYVHMEKLGMEKIGIGLVFYRLTPAGEALYQAIEQEKPVESEWARLNRLHEGERFEEHTAACLAFALHARRRGWRAKIMPEVTGKCAPDLAVMRNGEWINVEVELSDGREEKPSKWKNLAESNHGFVALCAATEERRSRLIAKCRTAQLPGMATDLKSLVTHYDKVRLEAELWAESW